MRGRGGGRGVCVRAEIITFFTQYRQFSWALILLSAATMCALYTLLSKRPPSGLRAGPVLTVACRGFRVLLLAVTGGAMVGACGEVTALLLPIGPAYALGVVACVLLAYWLSGKSLRPLAGISWALLALLGVAFVLLLAFAPEEPDAVLVLPALTVGESVRAAVFAIGYACLNLALSTGVVCGKPGEPCDRGKLRSGVCFGWIMALLMLLSNYVYLRHPSVTNATLPIVALLADFGRTGFLLGALLLLLALMTSLIGVLRGLRCELPIPANRRWMRWGIPVLPLAISLVGFSQIVGVLYPFLGLLCVAFVYAPLLLRGRRA